MNYPVEAGQRLHGPVEAGKWLYDPAEAGQRLYESAREWQKLQLAVLGFAGICGVLSGDNGSSRPLWLQDVSGITALTGLVLALIAVTTVATVAHPIATRPTTTATLARRLRWGIVFTFLAVGLTAVAGLSMWWPERTATPEETARVQVAITTRSGSACGTIVDSGAGSLVLKTNGEQVKVPLNRLLSMTPVDDC